MTVPGTACFLKSMEEIREKIQEWQYEEDDGRTIADMNVPGMPWYVEGDENREKGAYASSHEQMTDEELRTYRFAALKAGLIVALVFGLVFFLFIAFLDFIVFR